MIISVCALAGGLVALAGSSRAGTRLVGDAHFGSHAAGRGSELELEELGIGHRRVIFSAPVWDSYLPGLSDPDDARLDPAEPWELDEFLRQAVSEHFELFVTLQAMTAEPWGNTAVQEAVAQQTVSGMDLWGTPGMPLVWLRLVSKLVERLDGDGQHDLDVGAAYRPTAYWQIGNEFQTMYLGNPATPAEAASLQTDPGRDAERLDAFLIFHAATREAIRAQDAGARIVSGALLGLDAMAFVHGRVPESVTIYPAGFTNVAGCQQNDAASPDPQFELSRAQLEANPAYLRLAAQCAYAIPLLAQACDAVDYHDYHAFPFGPGAMAELRAQLGELADLPIVSTENAGPFYGYSLQAHACSVVKRHLLFLDQGGEIFFWSSMNPTSNWAVNFQNLALLDCAGERRSAPFGAFREMRSLLLDGATLVGRPDVHPMMHVFELRAPEREPAVLVFSLDGSRQEILPRDIPALAGCAQVELSLFSGVGDAGLQAVAKPCDEPLEVEADVALLRAVESSEAPDEPGCGCGSMEDRTSPPPGYLLIFGLALLFSLRSGRR
ncbi:MAG: hypothetical protein JXR96_21030 [Deltaproteobacteria bacterium]|nr:hypothetical protein [Deltaproteobacteria bacterium]